MNSIRDSAEIKNASCREFVAFGLCVATCVAAVATCQWRRLHQRRCRRADDALAVARGLCRFPDARPGPFVVGVSFA